MITLHHLNNSRSQRIIWLLEELELPYDIIYHQDAITAPHQLHRAHPLAKAPVLYDNEWCLAESGAIVSYLITYYGHSKFTIDIESANFKLALFWQHYADGTLMNLLHIALVFENIALRIPFLLRPLFRVIERKVFKHYLLVELRRNLNFIEAHLKNHNYFGGTKLSGSDILMTFILEALCVNLCKKTDYPNIHRYLETIHARPAYHRACKKGRWNAENHHNYWFFLGQFG